MIWLRSNRLEKKLILLQGLAFLLFAPLLVWLLRAQVDRLAAAELRRTGEHTAQLLAVVSGSYEEPSRRARLSQIYRDWIGADPQRLAYAIWVGPDGKAWAHSTASLVGQELHDPLSIITRKVQAPQADLDTSARGDEQVPVLDVKVPISRGKRAMGGLRLGFWTDVAARDSASYQTTVTLLGIIFMASLLLAGILTCQYLLAPLPRILKGAGHLLDGELETRLPPASQDELGQLAWSINQLAERLQGAFKRIEQLATTDGLTQVYNYYYFQARLAEELIRCQRYSRPVSLLLADIDHFRRYNDQYGHAAGDAVLWEVAQLLRKSVRQSDLVARYSGTQFALLLPETDLAEAEIAAEKIRQSAEHKAISFTRDGMASAASVTLSIGLTGFPASALNKDDLVAQSEAALQQAKELGKNRVVRFRVSESV